MSKYIARDVYIYTKRFVDGRKELHRQLDLAGDESFDSLDVGVAFHVFSSIANSSRFAIVPESKSPVDFYLFVSSISMVKRFRRIDEWANPKRRKTDLNSYEISGAYKASQDDEWTEGLFEGSIDVSAGKGWLNLYE